MHKIYIKACGGSVAEALHYRVLGHWLVQSTKAVFLIKSEN